MPNNTRYLSSHSRLMTIFLPHIVCFLIITDAITIIWHWSLTEARRHCRRCRGVNEQTTTYTCGMGQIYTCILWTDPWWPGSILDQVQSLSVHSTSFIHFHIKGIVCDATQAKSLQGEHILMTIIYNHDGYINCCSFNLTYKEAMVKCE